MNDLLNSPHTIFEPFRIKMVEPLPLPSISDRRQSIKSAHFNLFSLPAEAVTFDLLTDSGTSAMSANQWAGMMVGDESYAGSKSFKRFEQTVQNLTGMEHVIPTHQGRSAEDLLMKALEIHPGQTVVGNTHFDTTRANIEIHGAEAKDLPTQETFHVEEYADFKGNIDLASLELHLNEFPTKTPLVIMTATNNSVGGQPVSLDNLKKTKALLEPRGIPLFIDAARFAENAYFIKLREESYENVPIPSIVKEMFSIADGVLMSAKKDGFGNIGGFLATKDEHLAGKVRNLMVVTEGFPTYGGLAGRDLEALAIGLQEIQEEPYLQYRIKSTEYFGKGIADAGLPIVQPCGGHAVYIDAGACLPQIPKSEFPGQALAVALYEYVGIRGVEVGSVMLGHKDAETGEEIPAPHELVRLAIPRRVYTQSHVDYMIEGIKRIRGLLPELAGFEFSHEPKVLRHFTARFNPLSPKGT